MADRISIPSDTQQIASNYEKYKDLFTEESNDDLGQDQFLSLMVEQMKNQDFTNPTDNSEYMAQMAQFSMVQQMQQMNYYTNASYATSLVGKIVTTGIVDASSNSVVNTIGVVSGVRLNGTSFEIIVDGNSYQLKNIMEVLDPSALAKTNEDSTDEDAVAQSTNTTDTEASTQTENEEQEDPDYSQGIF